MSAISARLNPTAFTSFNIDQLVCRSWPAIFKQIDFLLGLKDLNEKQRLENVQKLLKCLRDAHRSNAPLSDSRFLHAFKHVHKNMYILPAVKLQDYAMCVRILKKNTAQHELRNILIKAIQYSNVNIIPPLLHSLVTSIKHDSATNLNKDECLLFLQDISRLLYSESRTADTEKE